MLMEVRAEVIDHRLVTDGTVNIKALGFHTRRTFSWRINYFGEVPTFSTVRDSDWATKGRSLRYTRLLPCRSRSIAV